MAPAAEQRVAPRRRKAKVLVVQDEGEKVRGWKEGSVRTAGEHPDGSDACTDSQSGECPSGQQAHLNQEQKYASPSMLEWKHQAIQSE